MVTIMPTTDGELVFMSRRRYLELCKRIDMLSEKIKKLEELDHARAQHIIKNMVESLLRDFPEETKEGFYKFSH